MLVSVVLPALNEADNIRPMTDRLRKVLEPLGKWEIIFVDDGSTDGSLALLKALNAEDRRVGYVSFTRNFGMQGAIRAGLAKASGDCVIMMDADLEKPPELIPDMVAAWKSGAEVVSTVNRYPPGTSLFKRTTSAWFYRVMNSLSDTRFEEGAADFRLLSRKAVDILLAFPERDLFWRGAVAWTGLRSTSITFTGDRRLHGKTKFSTKAMVRLALAGLTSFSTKPLQPAIFLGAAATVVAIVYAAFALAAAIFGGRAPEGWTIVLICVLLLGGINLLSTGIQSGYIGKLFMEHKGRPAFLVAEESPPSEPEADPGDRGMEHA